MTSITTTNAFSSLPLAPATLANLQQLGYTDMTPIQAASLPVALLGRDLIAQGFAESVVNDVVRKVDLNEYKRKQAAPGLKITPLAFGVGRRIPIVQKYVS